MASTVGSSSNIIESIGVAPIRSPANTDAKCSLCERSSASFAAICATPPARAVVPSPIGCPSAGERRLPWKSLKAASLTRIGSAATQEKARSATATIVISFMERHDVTREGMKPWPFVRSSLQRRADDDAAARRAPRAPSLIQGWTSASGFLLCLRYTVKSESNVENDVLVEQLGHSARCRHRARRHRVDPGTLRCRARSSTTCSSTWNAMRSAAVLDAAQRAHPAPLGNPPSRYIASASTGSHTSIGACELADPLERPKDGFASARSNVGHKRPGVSDCGARHGRNPRDVSDWKRGR